MVHSSEEQAVVAGDVPINGAEEWDCNNNNGGNNTNKKRKGFSKLGFVLATAGAAVGLGNIWRFPIQVHKYGGGAFVLMCLFFYVLLGGILLMLEIAIGRKSGEGVIGAFRALCKKFWWLGIMAALVPLLVLCYYNVIGGWALYYSIYYITYGMGQGFSGMGTDGGASAVYSGLLKGGNGYVSIIFTLIFLAAVVFVVLLGIQKGIEKVAKVVMPVLAVFILFVVIYTLCQGKAAWQGVKHFFVPNFKEFFGMEDAQGVATGTFSMSGVLAAVTQVFYSLSLGCASLITYGSYMQKKESIPTASTQIITFDAAICIMAGLIVIPALFILGSNGNPLESDGGSALLFVQLPQLFFKTGGQVGSLIFGSLFFTLVFFAAFTPAISQLEAVVDATMSIFKITRKKAVIIFGIFYAVMAMIISFGHAFDWRGLPMVAGKKDGVTIWTQMNIDDTIDFVASTLIVCVVSFLTCIASAWCSDFTQIQDEIGYKKKWSRSLYKIMIKYVAPILILVVMLWGIISSFVVF